eukprot:542421-Rhodomonas_salina.1
MQEQMTILKRRLISECSRPTRAGDSVRAGDSERVGDLQGQDMPASLHRKRRERRLDGLLPP